MSKKCSGCGSRTTASSGICQTCKSVAFHARKRIEKEGLLVDQAGTSWWVWDKKGEVLVIGKESKEAAILALGRGEEVEETEEA